MTGLKNKIKSLKPTFGSWITIGDPVVAEIMAKSGFEWLTIDMEHSAISLDKAQNLIRIIELSGCSPLVRVGENNPYLIKRVMDAGAHGVIVPMINNADDAKKAVNAVKYPPNGIRGVGLARAQKYGFDFNGYKKWLETESLIIAQIEHVEGVENLESIISVEGIDCCIVGPYDLSGSLGLPGEYNNPKVSSELQKIEKICLKNKMPLGFHVIPPDYKEVEKYLSKGYTFLAFSLDTLFLGTICSEQVNRLKNRDINEKT